MLVTVPTIQLIVFFVCIAYSTLIEVINIDGHEAVEAAEFAVRELKKLSDSGIYTTLSLHKIVAASFQRGVYHNNTILEIEISCPHFKSGHRVEKYNIIVMRHLEDGISSFAIDEFPVMDDDAIEQYYIQKVESKRKKREESFRRLELEAYFSRQRQKSDDYECLDAEAYEYSQKGRKISVEDHLVNIDSEEKLEERRIQSQERVNRGSIPLSLLQDEISVTRKSLEDLHKVVMRESKSDLAQEGPSDYEIQRASEILSQALEIF